MLRLLLISHSPFDRCARKISRYARNDDAGEDLAKGRRFCMTVEQPLEEGARRRRRIDLPRRGSLLRDGMKANVRQSVLSYRHRKRSRGIFYAVAVLCTHEVMIKSPGCFGGFSSHARRLTVVQGRFLAALEMTRGDGVVVLLASFPVPRGNSVSSHFLLFII